MYIKRIPPPLFYILIGLIISALLGIAESHLLLDKPLRYREKMLWKYTVLFYALSMASTLLFYFKERYLPVLPNLLKFIGINIVFSLPYFTALVLTGSVSINAVLTILPAQIIFLAIVFIWHVANEIDPELEKNTTKITIKGLIISVVVFFIMGLLNIPTIIALALGSLTLLGYNLLLLKRAKNKTLKSKLIENKQDNN